jgi:hypothetical protein
MRSFCRSRALTRSSSAALLVVPVLLLAAACGGGGTNTQSVTVTLPAVFDRTGDVYTSGVVRHSAMAPSFTYIAGDGGDNGVNHGFVAIKLTSLPAGAKVDSAILHQISFLLGGDAFGKFGALVVDHVDLGAGLNAADFNGGTLTAGIAEIPAFGPGETVDTDLTAAVQADVAAGRTVSSFRLQFPGAPSIDGVSDTVSFDCYISDSARQPTMTVTYHL